jgi:hypothetical protein
MCQENIKTLFESYNKNIVPHIWCMNLQIALCILCIFESSSIAIQYIIVLPIMMGFQCHYI